MGPAAAQANGLFGLAFASGTNAGAASYGFLGVAISVGYGAQTVAGYGYEILQLGNLAIDYANHTGGLNAVVASGLGNVAANFGGKDMFLFANGAFNSTTNVSGTNNDVSSSGFLTSAFVVQSRNTNVTAGTGAFALAGSFQQNNQTVEQAPFGVNINGIGIPPAAASARQAAVHSDRKSVTSKPVSSSKTDTTRTTGPKAKSARSAR
jgi:hypothetical protein